MLDHDSRQRGALQGLIGQIETLLRDPEMLQALGRAGGAQPGDLNETRLRAHAMNFVKRALGMEQQIERDGVLNHYQPDLIEALTAGGRNTPEERTLLRTQAHSMGVPELSADSLMMVVKMEQYRTLASQGRFDVLDPQFKDFPETQPYTDLWDRVAPETRDLIISWQQQWAKVAEWWGKAIGGKAPEGAPPADPWGIGAMGKKHLTLAIKGRLEALKPDMLALAKDPTQFSAKLPAIQEAWKQLKPMLQGLPKNEQEALVREVFGADKALLGQLLVAMKKQQIVDLAKAGRVDQREPQFTNDERFDPFTLIKSVAYDGQWKQQVDQMQGEWGATAAYYDERAHGRSQGAPPPDTLGLGGILRPKFRPAYERSVTADAFTVVNGRAVHERVTLPHRVQMPLEPGTYQISDRPGPRVHPTRGGSDVHTGLDMATYEGRSGPIHAATGGTVVAAERTQGPYGYGNSVVVRSPDGVYTRYAHMAEAPEVSEGQQVAVGDVLGQVGTTGASTGNHLHFEVYVERDGKNVYFNAEDVKFTQRGDNGPEVAHLQQALRDRGYGEHLGGPDGPFGPLTEAALKAFQRDNGLRASGVLDDETAQALYGPAQDLPRAEIELKRGDRGEAVSALQEKLHKLGYGAQVGAIDGIFGPKTESGVRAFQLNRGLIPSGVVDHDTMAAIDAALANPVPDVPPRDDAPPRDGDAFWQGVGEAPVSMVNGKLAFSSQFQDWADRFNERISKKWSEVGTDFAGTTGTDQLMLRYGLTPQKVQEVWQAATERNVDPRLLLAILSQEGTGSFNTNIDNAREHGGGHGAEPDWRKDLDLAFDKLVVAKIRLYPAAVSGGFQGNWVDYINWYTPIDDSAAGRSGVYAADMHWGLGVRELYEGLVRKLEPGNSDPVGNYAHWMTTHAELLMPQHVQPPFRIEQGLPDGVPWPHLAVHPSRYDRDRYPGAVRNPVDGYYYFSAPPDKVWRLVH